MPDYQDPFEKMAAQQAAARAARAAQPQAPTVHPPTYTLPGQQTPTPPSQGVTPQTDMAPQLRPSSGGPSPLADARLPQQTPQQFISMLHDRAVQEGNPGAIAHAKMLMAQFPQPQGGIPRAQPMPQPGPRPMPPGMPGRMPPGPRDMNPGGPPPGPYTIYGGYGGPSQTIVEPNGVMQSTADVHGGPPYVPPPPMGIQGPEVAARLNPMANVPVPNTYVGAMRMAQQAMANNDPFTAKRAYLAAQQMVQQAMPNGVSTPTPADTVLQNWLFPPQQPRQGYAAQMPAKGMAFRTPQV